MDKLGRNDRCHCGSGKKYKSCCLAIDQQNERIGRARVDMLGDIYAWLEQRHPGFHDQAVADLLGEGHRELAQRLEEALGLAAMREHWLEWAFSEAAVEADGTRVTALELLGEEGAPRLEGDVGSYLSALLRAPLQAWSVETCTLTVTLRNLVTGDLVELDEPGLSGFLVEGDLIGLRVFEWNGKWQRFWEPWFCSEELEGLLEGATADSHLARLIADEWLEDALAALEEPAGWEGGVWRTLYAVSEPAAMAAKLIEAGGAEVEGRPFLFVETEDFSAELDLIETDLVVTTATEEEAELADAFVCTTWGSLVKYARRDFDPFDGAEFLDSEEEATR